jgi:peptide/nickel transport system substrate-binding protein
MRSKSQKMFVILMIFAVLGLSAVVGAQNAAITTLRIGTTYMIDTLGPGSGYYGYDIRGLFYETLVEAADNNNVEPGLAESWSVSEDGLTWTFKIREGVAFSDGTPLTAADAAWTINWIIENQVVSMVSYLAFVESAEAPDATTLLMKLSEPVSNMISSKLLYVYILPPHVWEGKTAEEIAEFNDPESTIGAGPYHLVDYQPDEYMILEANDNYWRGQPPVDQIIYQQYSTEDALVQALAAGEIDLAKILPTSGVQTLEQTENVQVITATGLKFLELSMNVSEDGTQPASVRDPQVRLAIDHAIDRQQIVTVGYFGLAEPAEILLPPAMAQWRNTDLQIVPYDIAEANRILDEAGYVDTNGDDIREDADGNPLEYRLAAPDSDAYYPRILEIIADGLSQIGISAPPYTQSTESLTVLQVDYDYDMILWDWSIDADPHFLTSVFTCDEMADGGWNDTGYCNPDYDALFRTQATATDDEQRRDALWKIQQMVYDDRPWIILVYPQAISGYRSDRFTFDPNLPNALLKWGLFTGFSIVQ